jgi:hypothetical protein
MATAPDDASVSSADDSILIMAQTHDVILPPQRKPYADAVLTQVAVSGPTSLPACHPISSDLLLLDSQSS